MDDTLNYLLHFNDNWYKYKEEVQPLKLKIESLTAKIREAECDCFNDPNLPPEAFKGYGGQTPQYNYPSEPELSEEFKELHTLYDRLKALKLKYNIK